MKAASIFVAMLTASFACSTASVPEPSISGSRTGETASSTPTAPIDWSAPVDFDALRLEWGQRDDFGDLCDPTKAYHDEVGRLIQQEKWEELSAVASAKVTACPVDIQSHAYLSGALQKLGRESEAQVHSKWGRGLVESILRSGDGKSPETAFEVISVAEEYAVLSAFGLRATSQETLGSIDAVRFSNGKTESTMFFSPKAHWQRIKRKLDTLPQ